MTIDQRVEAYLAESVDYQMAAEGIKHEARKSLKSLLLEVARDQRNTCAEAIAAIEIDNEDGIVGVGRMRYAAKQAVMNAGLKGEMNKHETPQQEVDRLSDELAASRKQFQPSN